MKELAEYRINLVKRLEGAANEFREVCLQVNDAFAPVDEEGWNVHQIAVHTRDVDELVYAMRARRTAVEDNPEFPNFDGEAYMLRNYNSSEPIEQVVNRLVENVRSLVEWLRALPPASWSRVSHHTILGNDLTLQTWVERDLAHIEEHLETLKNFNNS